MTKLFYGDNRDDNELFIAIVTLAPNSKVWITSSYITSSYSDNNFLWTLRTAKTLPLTGGCIYYIGETPPNETTDT